ncbi:MAG: ASKHA domain-containing protein [Dissulfurispiraceae bacterium]
MLNPLVSSISVSLDRPSNTDKRADRERLVDGLLAVIGNERGVEIDLVELRELPFALRENDYRVTLNLGFTRDKVKVISLGKSSSYAIAIDIGTTNLVASLFDVEKLRRIGYMELENPQIIVGLDVLTRVHAAMGGRGQELHQLMMQGVNDLIARVCAACAMSETDICGAVIAGNTIMTHFLLNLSVDNIPMEPYIPVSHRFDFIAPNSIGLNINSKGIVYVFPNAGSYVGGDIISGILSSGLYKAWKPSLLVDVGTNAEIVLGCDEWIVVGAGAAGPALESGISEIGMRALEGAVHEVTITSDTHEVILKTVGGKEPRGVCGSGMIELVSELYDAGIIDGHGKFNKVSKRVVEFDGHKGFLLYGEGGRQLIIKDLDIENFLRSKAAMFASLYVIVKSVGLSFGDINRVYVSGAFGNGINTEKAASIGMIPTIDKRKFVALGNSSLTGAQMLLLNTHLLADIDRICEIITYREMNTDGEFMREFPAALFIPHTTPEVLQV